MAVQIHRPNRSTTLMAATAMLIVGLLSACAGEVPEVDAADAVLVQGREIYSRSCAGCHGADGGGATGPKLNEGLMEANYPDPADQAEIIANGRGQMPAYTGKLTGEEIDAVVRYTREAF